MRSEPGGGSIFTVLLPATRGASGPIRPLITPGAMLPLPVRPVTDPPPDQLMTPGAPSPSPPPATPEPADGRDILVIDDEPMVGRAITRMLVPPHRVVFVGSAAEALARLADGRFDTILCDLMMPDMTGMALYERLVVEAPAHAARMVFLTGGAFTPEAGEFLERVPNARLEKPFTPTQLRAAVAAVISVPRG